jgi:hypothetical protein
MHSVRTSLAKGDISGAILARLTRPGAILKAWAVWTIVVAALIAFARGAPQGAVDALVLAISAATGALLSVAFSIAFTLLRVRRALKTGDGVLGDHDYVLKEDGLHEKTSVNETLAKWSGIEGVQETRGFTFIEMRSGSFHIIPRRSFRSAEHAAAFIAEVRRRATSGI